MAGTMPSSHDTLPCLRLRLCQIRAVMFKCLRTCLIPPTCTQTHTHAHNHTHTHTNTHQHRYYRPFGVRAGSFEFTHRKKEAPYIIVSDLPQQAQDAKGGSKPEASSEILPEIYNIRLIKQLLVEQWKLERPDVIITITGGATDFDMSSTTNNDMLMKGLMDTRALKPIFITGGSNSGIMEYVGKARAKYTPHVVKKSCSFSNSDRASITRCAPPPAHPRARALSLTLCELQQPLIGIGSAKAVLGEDSDLWKQTEWKKHATKSKVSLSLSFFLSLSLSLSLINVYTYK
jgi:hypothetical protein